MGSLYRSEGMCLAQLFLQSEAAYACVAELGELGLVQFRDLNPDVNAFQRKFVNEVRRCDEMERKLRYLEKEILRAGIPILDTGENPDAPAPREMIDLEACFEKLENELKEVNTNQEALKRNFLELTELKHILRKTQHFFDEAEFHHQQMHDGDGMEEAHKLLGDDGPMIGRTMRLGFVAGVIQRERIHAFEQMLWRVCRGNVFLRQAEIDTALEDPSTGDQVQKSVFIIFFQGDQLKSRVKKICEGFRATLYPCHETQAERRETAIGVMTRIEDLQVVISQTDEHRQRVLVSAAKNVRVWFIKVRKLKAIYHTLNLFNLDVTQKCLIAECWCPITDLDKIQMALRRGTERSGSTVPSILNRMETSEDPPTYNKVNKFTSCFQSLVDAYGVCTYGEVNPAPFTIITYPFLFSIMFGDLGHGTIMFLFGLWLVLREKQLHASLANHEMFGTVYGGRYVLMMMGFFSIYTGFVYNDCFSKSFNIFGSTWNVSAADYSHELLEQDISLVLDPKLTFNETDPYPFGVDPIWQLASNKINFLNSFKMKMSVIFGIGQMLFGVILSLFNHMHFKRSINIWCEFLPQLIFMLSIFGYLVFLIFYKWLFIDVWNMHNAPSLILTLINMGLLTPPDPVMFPGQVEIQKILIIIGVACIPWMLFPKPIIMKLQHDKKVKKAVMYRDVRMLSGKSEETAEVLHHDELEAETSGAAHNASKDDDFDFGDTFVYQAIHTIEYCLGCISHTASYLRLWALSLAHAELSEVLWNMMLAIGLRMNGYVGAFAIWAIFAIWGVLTISILLFMEGLSAFLHTLRLHWVEFQSKFFKGEGYAFIPFSFDIILQAEEE
ncbi:V-type proton ATPase 116 kDa subunit a-like isoform X1 [Strongylocentrotus purpuratus]|uniref:V-type proton ATPase subunit a n=1 Tax=Strongylocentrotus purpuratus TaxID=7668 RepID=A0A7M7T4B8_STRPU|nr:V-type proton ATPase 116 kDa subunit a-like isoform X1 [Strongylocentrotus purpuratus]XP_030852885.1 V-type proton ATPase 116 kDa subunit a-like isoform X1 [Strongylocentrotus purpuratus]